MKINFRYLAVILVVPVVIITLWGFPKEPYTGFIADPVQSNLGAAESVLIKGDRGDVSLSLLAHYSIEAVVKSKNRQSDYAAQISKYDLALAWGTLNDPVIDSHISYGQSGRFYFYHWSPGITVSPDYIASHSANVHLIHSNSNVLRAIKGIDEDDHIRLEGFLVNANFKDGAWKTSLTRNDTGNGSCEILYVTDVEVFEHR